jgi:uncharacterized protein (TIGR03382 family)
MRRLGLAVLLAGSIAHANGRPPITNGIHFRPGDPHSLYVATTFGLLISHDDGCTFNWLCENNIGYGGPFDPKYRIAQDGSIFATTYKGLRVSRDGGCSFTTATSSIWVDALDIGPTGEVWIATADTSQPNDILSSSDNGTTFQSKGMLSPTIWWKSVAVAPSDAQRVYVTGYQVAGMAPDGGQMQPTGHFFRSTDDGAHWTESALAGVKLGVTPTPLVAAVDPSNEDIVYLVSLAANPPSGDLLYRSSDGGTTFTQVLATPQPITGVIVHDAQTVFVSTASGLQRSNDGGTTFSPMSNPPQLGCLGQRADGTLVGCGANWAPDCMAVGQSNDGTAWQRTWRFVDLAGPLSCPAGTTEHDDCDQMEWNNLKMQFGATGPACGGPSVPAGTVALPDGGATCAASGSGGAHDAGSATAPKKSGGCCDAGGAPAGLVWALFVGAALLRNRRRSRPAARSDSRPPAT